jgi:hypothetical protein
MKLAVRLDRSWFRFWLVVCLIPASAAGSAQESSEPPNDLVVHEWGTFLAMQGSDVVTLDGMYHEEHSLPEFVHARGRDQLRQPAAARRARG